MFHHEGQRTHAEPRDAQQPSRESSGPGADEAPGTSRIVAERMSGAVFAVHAGRSEKSTLQLPPAGSRALESGPRSRSRSPFYGLRLCRQAWSTGPLASRRPRFAPGRCRRLPRPEASRIPATDHPRLPLGEFCAARRTCGPQGLPRRIRDGSKPASDEGVPRFTPVHVPSGKCAHTCRLGVCMAQKEGAFDGPLLQAACRAPFD